MFDQLREGGRLVAAVGVRQCRSGHLFVKEGGAVSGRRFFNLSVKSVARFPQGRRVCLLGLHQGCGLCRVAIVALLRDGNLMVD
jgi:hypothetical protein